MVDEPDLNHNSDLDNALNGSLNALDNQINANLNDHRETGTLGQSENPSGQDGANPPIGEGGQINGANPSAGGGGESPTNDETGETPNQEQDDFDGMSHAYAGSAKPLQAKKPESKSKSTWPTPPKKNDTKVKAPSGKTLHEMLWNELLSFYEWVIDKSVDLVLDFTTFVLYPQPTSSDDKEETKDIFIIGNLQFENWKKEQLKNKDEVVAMHKEILENLEKQKIGSPLVWEHLGEKPEFFDNLYAIYEKANKATPCTREEREDRARCKRVMEQFSKLPDYLEKIFKNSEKIGRIAYNKATLEEYMNPKQQKEIAKHINEQAKSEYEVIMTNINKIRAAYGNNPEEMKNMISRYSSGISNALEAAYMDIKPFYEGNKKIKKANKTAINEKLAAVNVAINDFMIVNADGDQSKISEVPAPENGNIRIPFIIAPKGASDEVQQEQRQRGMMDISDLFQRFYERGERRA